MCNYSVYVKTQGIKEGMERGMKRGMERRNKEIARKLLGKNMSDEDIMDATGISKEELQTLKEMTLAAIS